MSDAVAQDLQDPRIGFVTMTSVKTTPDLRHARVYVSVLGTDEQRAATLAGLASAHGALQRRLARDLRMTQPQASKHLRVLCQVGLVRVRGAGKQRRYGLDARGLRPVHE